MVHLGAIGVTHLDFVLELTVKTPPLSLTLSVMNVIPELRAVLEECRENIKGEQSSFGSEFSVPILEVSLLALF